MSGPWLTPQEQREVRRLIAEFKGDAAAMMHSMPISATTAALVAAYLTRLLPPGGSS
jgi:hypothetical protein